jgi:GAF domain-containing protein
VSSNSLPNSNLPVGPNDRSLQRVVDRLSQTMDRDALVQKTASRLREGLAVDRVVLYYFFRQWEGRVTFEALSAAEYSILGSSGPDDCFNGEYAAMYEAGRVKAIADIEQAPIADCHREFLRELQVRSNLVVPVLTQKGLWGLLVAHHCQSVRDWQDADVQLLQAAALTLATAPSICES